MTTMLQNFVDLVAMRRTKEQADIENEGNNTVESDRSAGIVLFRIKKQGSIACGIKRRDSARQVGKASPGPREEDGLGSQAYYTRQPIFGIEVSQPTKSSTRGRHLFESFFSDGIEGFENGL